MRVGRLKELLENIPDEVEVFVRNSVNVCGNISGVSQLEKSAYGFFVESLPALFINSDHSMVEHERGEYAEFIETSGNKGCNKVIVLEENQNG